jgi:lipopolysaccharide export system protein LptA
MFRTLSLIGLAGVALAALLPSALSAEPTAPSDNQPLQIQADSGIEWQQDAHLYIARGNAVATRGAGELHADTLIAHYRDVKGHGAITNTGGNTEIYRVDAEGHILLKRGEQNVVGDRAVYDVDRAIAVVTGRNLKLTTPTDTVTARDSLEWYDQKQVAVARGNAVAIRNGRTIKGDVLTAYMVKNAPVPGKPAPAPAKPPVTKASAPGKVPGVGAESSKISRVDAQGHVVVSNGLDVGRGDFGVYNAETGIATLIGNVVIERGKDVIRGQRGVMDLNKNISRMLPGGAPGAAHQRVQGLFVREDRATARTGAAGGNPPAANPPPGGDRRR